MSTEDAVQEVRRIFLHNSVEQAYDYLRTITRGIQESDERLKQIVGQSYRDLIAACDRVVGMEQTCRRLLSLQRRLRVTPVGAEAEGAAAEHKSRLWLSPSSPSLSSSSSLLLLSSSSRGAMEAQRRAVALEGLFGAFDVRRAAAALRVSEDNDACARYKDRLDYTMRELIRSDADGAAVRSAAALHRFVGIQMFETFGGAAVSGSGATAPARFGDEMEKTALAHLAEVHEALTIVEADKGNNNNKEEEKKSAAHALWRLIELVTSVLQADLDIITSDVERKKNFLPNTEDPNGKSVRAVGMEWILAVMPLPPCMREPCGENTNSSQTQTWFSADEEHRTQEVDIPEQQAPHRSVAKDTVLALHILQRAQYLFFHLVMYVASVAHKFCGTTAVSEEDVWQPKRNDNHNETEEDEYAYNQQQRRAMHNLVTLRGRLVSQQQQQQHAQEQQVRDSASSDIPFLCRSGSFVRDALAASHRPKSEDSADVSSPVPIIHAGTAALSAEDASRRRRTRAMYLREVTFQVCGLQVLDPYALRQDTQKTQAPSVRTEHEAPPTEPKRHLTETHLSYEKLCEGLAGAQHIVERLMSEMAEGGYMRDPRCIGLQEQLARHGAIRLQQRLAARAESKELNAHTEITPTALLFNAEKWIAVTGKAGERAILIAIDAALKKTERITAFILERSCARCPRADSTAHDKNPHEEWNAKPTKAIFDLPGFSRRLLRQSLCVSERIARAHKSSGYEHPHPNPKQQPAGHYGTAFAWTRGRHATKSAGINSANSHAFPAGHRTVDAALARAVAKYAWSQQKSVSAAAPSLSSVVSFTHDAHADEGREGALSPLLLDNTQALSSALRFPEVDIFAFIEEGGNHTSGTNTSHSKNGNLNQNVSDTWALGFADDAAAALFVDDDSSREDVLHNTCDSNATDAEKETNGEEAEEGEYNGAADCACLRRMLQSTFVAAHVMKTAKSAALGRITHWISTVLQRVQELMRRVEKSMLEENKQREDPPHDGEERSVANESHVTWAMIVFDRLSMLVEVILQIVEHIWSEDESHLSFLVEDLRSTAAICRRPWIQLLRNEWQHGLCAAYREAFENASGKRFALVYAGCWQYSPTDVSSSTPGNHCDDNSNSSRVGPNASSSHARVAEQQQQPQPPPQQQHRIGYPVHMTPHISDLLFLFQHILYTAGTSRHLEATVLPVLRREVLEATATALRDVVLPSFRVDDDILLQLIFDLRYITALFVDPSSPDAAPCRAVLQTLQNRVDPIVWTLASAPLFRAGDALRRATALSFGAWAPAELCTNADFALSPSFVSFAAPRETERFALLPLAVARPPPPPAPATPPRPLAQRTTTTTEREREREREREKEAPAARWGGEKSVRGWMDSLW